MVTALLLSSGAGTRMGTDIAMISGHEFVGAV